MKVHKIITILLLAGGVLLASPSCTREEWNNPVPEEPAGIPVSLSLSVAGMDAGTPETKTIMEPDIDNPGLEEQVKNLVVLQFEGSGDNAKLVALPKYYKDAASIFNGTEQIRLLPSTKPNTIVVIANTFSNIFTQSEMTLGQFLDWDYNRLYDCQSVLTRDTDGNDYLRMSGSTDVGSITPTTSLSISLKRNVSKITIQITNEDPTVTLHHVQLRDINAKYYYLTNIDGFKDEYSDSDPCRIDKDPEVFNTNEFTYYVPANLRGQNSSTAQYTKGLGAPEGATRFCLYGKYGSGVNKTDINYTYYLGGNLINDFDLKPNYHYTYNITIFPHSKDNVQTDYRIEDCSEVKFLVDANCYMVQPPIGKDQSRIYAIPVRRIAAFWNTLGENDGIYGANNNNISLKISKGIAWDALILWSDFLISDPSDFLCKSSGTGYDTDDSFFKIKVKNGMKGNVVVAVKIGDSIIWSWHIWITDYNPDNEGLSGTYTFGVEGGNVHRYDNAAFRSGGDYQNGFIMDRNLGASSASYQGLNGTMYYQYGRKDPFIGYNQNGQADRYYTYTSEGTPSEKNVTDNIVDRASATRNLKNIIYAVRNPMKFITAEYDEQNLAEKDGEWTIGDPLGPNDKPWLDSKYDFDNTLHEKNKSIYDPCPPGWKVPAGSVFNGISQKGWANGLIYGPDEASSVYFPAHSLINGASGVFMTSYLKSRGFVRNADSIGSEVYYPVFHYYDSSNTYAYPTLQAHAIPVRCVRESPYERSKYIAD